MRRSFFIALLVSALGHLLLLAAPGWHIGSLIADDAVPIEAQLMAPVAKSAPAIKPTPRKVTKKIVPHSEPASDPASGQTAPADNSASETVAATEAHPESDPEKTDEPVAPEPAIVAAPELEPEVMPEVALVLPRSGHIRYSVIRGDGGFVVGQSIQEWHHDGKRYNIRATTETTGIAAIFKPLKVWQTSEGSFLKGEMKPDVFRFDRGGNDMVTASFDWQAQQVTLGDGHVFAITDGAEDVLSMFFQLTQAAQRGEGFVMAVATGKKVERYAFEWLGEEELKIKAGHFHAWHVRVRAASGGKDTTEIWLGHEVAGLPIKIRNTDRKGDIFDQVAEEITYEGQ